MIHRQEDGTAARVVFDTNVLLSLWVFEDSRFASFRRQVECGEWQALTDPDCLAEFRRVLSYPQFDLDPERQVAIHRDYAAIAQLCEERPTFSQRLPRCSDRDDQKFLELARNSAAGWLVTSDKALLKMARRDKLVGLFRIVTPEAVLAGMQMAEAA